MQKNENKIKWEIAVNAERFVKKYRPELKGKKRMEFIAMLADFGEQQVINFSKVSSLFKYEAQD